MQSLRTRRELYSKQSETTGRKRKMPTIKTRPAVFTRSMAAIAGTTDNGQTVVTSDMDIPTDSEMKVLEKYIPKENLILTKLKTLSLAYVNQGTQLKLMSEENSYLKSQLIKSDKYCDESNIQIEHPLNELSSTPASPTCSSGTVDLSSAEVFRKQVIESKKNTNSQGDSIVLVRNLGSLEPNSKPHKIKKPSTRTRNLGKMREFVVVTENGGYYTCLGDFDPNEDRDVSYRRRDLELPSWRIKSFSNGFTMDATDICSETIAQIQYYSKCEKNEKKRKRWDLQRARELRQIDYLKEGRYKKNFQNLNDKNTEQDVRSLLPNLDGINILRVTDNLPVSAFGCNLHIKKNAKLYKFHCSKWCNDGTEPPKENNNQEMAWIYDC